MFGFGIQELLVILAIVLLIFGPKRLKNIGSDLGNAIKGFRTAVADEDKPAETAESAAAKVIDGEECIQRRWHAESRRARDQVDSSFRVQPSKASQTFDSGEFKYRMFSDFGSMELMLIVLVTLLVIGPERLPETLRTLGLWMGRISRSLPR